MKSQGAVKLRPKTMARNSPPYAPVHTQIDPVRHMGRDPAKLPLQDSDAVKSAHTGKQAHCPGPLSLPASAPAPAPDPTGTVARNCKMRITAVSCENSPGGLSSRRNNPKSKSP